MTGLVALGIMAAALTGCTHEQDQVPTPAINPVTAYGITLDGAATPRQVAYVLLRAMADDVIATQANKPDEQKAAMDLTFSLAAYHTIEKRLPPPPGQRKKTAGLGPERDARLYESVKTWAPMIAYYVKSIPADADLAIGRMVERIDEKNLIADVYCPLSHDPTETHPARQQRATLKVELAMEKAGGVSYWRVSRLDYPGIAADQILETAGKPAPSTTTSTGDS